MIAVDHDRGDVELPAEQPEAVPVARWPLKGLLPPSCSYEVARVRAERGELRAKKVGGRWFATRADVEAWLASTGRLTPR